MMSNKSQFKVLISVIITLLVLSFSFFANPAISRKIENSDNFVSKIFFHKSFKESREPDFSAYMKNLQRKIKKNWNPPKADMNKKVVVRFRILKNGKMAGYKIIQSSGDTRVDFAAIKALKKSSPFARLPRQFKGSSVDVEFTFDYKVFGLN